MTFIAFLTMKVVSEIPCFSCREPGHCCTEEYPDQNLIMITLHDADRVSKATGLKIADFAEFRKVKQPRRDELEDDEKYYLVDDSALYLKKRNSRCVFLGEDYKCTIHDHRPRLCRMYPFWYEGEGDDIKIVRMNDPSDDECPAMKGVKRLCPAAFARMVETRESLAACAKEYDEELEEYNRYKAFFLKYSPDELLSRLKKGGFF